MKKHNRVIAALALTLACAVSGWVLPACSNRNKGLLQGAEEGATVTETPAVDPQTPSAPDTPQIEVPTENPAEKPAEKPATPTVSVPKEVKAEYIKISSDGVNIRSGAGAGYTKLGTAEKGTLYQLCGKSGEWYKTVYRHKTAYVSAKYCTVVQMSKSASERIEKVIEEGYKCLGVPYIYGATRYHDGSGNKLSGFTRSEFDCSSLMQYIFKLGADINLQVNTRTQIYQGKTVQKSGLKRGDLMFFTNASRKYNTGVERVGHVALYLGDNYILHTASDYAKIEQISSTRWGYYIQSQRMI